MMSRHFQSRNKTSKQAYGGVDRQQQQPNRCICNIWVRTVVKLCTFGIFGIFFFRGELGFLNCDTICICVVNKQVELLDRACLITFILFFSMM